MPIYKTGKKKAGEQQYRVFVSYTDANGEYCKKTKTVYGLAAAKMAELRLTELIKAEPAAKSNISVNDLFELYIADKRHNVRTSTLEKTIRFFKHDILPILGHVKLNKLNLSILSTWKETVQERPLAVRTRRNIYSELRAMLNWAVKMEYLPGNPLVRLDNFKEVLFEKPQDKLHFYTPEQFKLYITAAAAMRKTFNSYGCYVFFNIAYYTGARKGEINALKWTDIEGNIMHIRRSVAQKIKGQPIVETPPKNRSSYRDIQLPKVLLAILAEHKQMQQQLKGFNNNWRVCGGWHCLSDTSISNANIAYAKAAGLPVIRIHDFRHSHASLLANNGINIQEIARRLGHSKVEMTWNTYAHLYPAEQEKALEVLEKL